MKLSIIIPVYNEEKTITDVLKKVSALKIPQAQKEVIVINDGSTDKTSGQIKKYLQKDKNIKFVEHEKNKGKGAAVIMGIIKASGDYIIIQDADLEYDVNDIPKLFSHVMGKNDVIYGSRLNRLPNFKKEESRGQFMMHYFGNRFLSLVTSVLYGAWVTDMETCYKLFPASAVRGMKLNAQGFEFEPEITAKLLKKGLKIREYPIKTNPRGYEEGKKLNTFRDGTKALWNLCKYRFSD